MSDQQVDRFNHVQEHFVLSVFGALVSPRNCICHSHGRPGLRLQLVRLLRDVFLQDLGLGYLRIPEIHHLIEQLVDDDKVVADGFFFEFFEIFNKDVAELVQEEQDCGGVCVLFGGGDNWRLDFGEIWEEYCRDCCA